MAYVTTRSLLEICILKDTISSKILKRATPNEFQYMPEDTLSNLETVKVQPWT